MTKLTNKNRLDAFAVALAQKAIAWRWLVIVSSVAIAIVIGQNASLLEFSNNYRTFFSKANPELQEFEEFQATYTKNDTLMFVLVPKNDEDIFTRSTLTAVEELTEQAWQIPYTIRVDSLSNFQHTFSAGDDLNVEDLFAPVSSFDDAEIEKRKEIALNEPLLNGLVVTGDGNATAVIAVVQYPEKSLTEVPEAVAHARMLRANIKEKYPELNVYLTGGSMLNNAFSEAAVNDFALLIPLMFFVILLTTALTVRSFSAMFSTVVIVILSSAVAMGVGGLVGIKLAGPSPNAPIIIMTLAIADSIHILISMRAMMRNGLAKNEAIVEAVRINFVAVSVTSITTVIGFMSLQFSDSPPFRDLGFMTAVGILAAWVFSLTLLPALLSLMKIKVTERHEGIQKHAIMDGFADFTIKHAKLIFAVGIVTTVALVAQIPSITLSDNWIKYFAPRIEVRAETDKANEYFGFHTVEFSVPASRPGGISDPKYLEKLDQFAAWLRHQENVTHVYTVTDIFKRLNKNMHEDDESYYQIPDDSSLAAQYLLLYELSLPYGLDLNDRVNIDKSASRVTVSMQGDTPTIRFREFLADAESWFEENAPELKAPGTGGVVMFTFIAQRNVQSMVVGTVIAIIAIAVIMILTLRSVSMGLVSLVPNGLPILTAFGLWAVLVGEVGFSVAAVAAISLGIVIDDTVHFLTKYMRARREKNLPTTESIRYAFQTVGVAIVVNTVILSAGFIMLAFSAFKINAEMGLLTVMTIVSAFVLDFLFLPAVLVLLARMRGEGTHPFGEYNEGKHVKASA